MCHVLGCGGRKEGFVVLDTAHIVLVITLDVFDFSLHHVLFLYVFYL